MRNCTQRLKRLYRKAELAPGRELKAAFTPRGQVLRLLEEIGREDVHIVAVVVDKRGVCREPADAEDWYRAAVARACWRCARRWPSQHIFLDRRYTHPVLQNKLEKTIRQELVQLDTPWIPIEQLDSAQAPGLQLVAFEA